MRQTRRTWTRREGTSTTQFLSLTGSAANSLMSSGQSLLGTSLGAYQQQEQMSQDQLSNWANSLFGGALTGGAAIGLGAAGKADWSW